LKAKLAILWDDFHCDAKSFMKFIMVTAVMSNKLVYVNFDISSVLGGKFYSTSADCNKLSWSTGENHGRDRMVVEFTITYAISAYHHWCCEFESRSGRGVQHYVIKFVSDLRQVSGLLWVLRFPSPIKLTATI
jgi:hypothetical protein